MRNALCVALLLATTAASAQTARVVQSLQLWPEVQGELALKNGDYLLLALRGERNISDLYTNRVLGFNVRRVRLGYEHFWSPAWSWGVVAQLAGDGSNSAFIPGLLLRHRSPVLGGITFGQRLLVEHTFTSAAGAPLGDGPDGQFWGGLRLDLEKLLPLTGDAVVGLALRPRLSYEAGTHLRLQKAANDLDERTIQYTSLRGEVGVRLSSTIDVTPWFAYQTSYLETLPQYDKNGVQTSGGKLNFVSPTLGLDVRFTILPSGGKVNYQQLPTQH